MVLQPGAATNIAQPDNPNAINISHCSKDMRPSELCCIRTLSRVAHLLWQAALQSRVVELERIASKSHYFRY